jgi:hypothetical protein
MQQIVVAVKKGAFQLGFLERVNGQNLRDLQRQLLFYGVA